MKTTRIRLSKPVGSAPVTVILTAANMGDVTEADFDAWAAFVAARIDERTGLDVTVEQARFGGLPDIDQVDDAEHCQTVREALASLWEEFCGDDSAWPAGQS